MVAEYIESSKKNVDPDDGGKIYATQNELQQASNSTAI